MDTQQIMDLATSINDVQRVGYKEGYGIGYKAGYAKAMQEMREILNKDKEVISNG